jgi:hypothetical protein
MYGQAEREVRSTYPIANAFCTTRRSDRTLRNEMPKSPPLLGSHDSALSQTMRLQVTAHLPGSGYYLYTHPA